MREKSPLPHGSVVPMDYRISQTQYPDTNRKRRVHFRDIPEHPVRGDPIFIPGIIAMVFGFSLILAGVAYNSSTDGLGSRSLAISLIGIGIFLLVFGELFCILICFLRRKKIEKWKKEHCEPLLNKKKKLTHKEGNRKSRDHVLPRTTQERIFELKIYSKKSRNRDKDKPSPDDSRSRVGETQFTSHGPTHTPSSMPSDPPSYEEAMRI